MKGAFDEDGRVSMMKYYTVYHNSLICIGNVEHCLSMTQLFEQVLMEGVRAGYLRLHNDGAKIEYLPSGHKENLKDPEEQVRATYYFDLIEKYNYPDYSVAT